VLLQGGDYQPFLEYKFLGNDMAVIPFRIPRRSGDVLFQSGIFEEDDQQPVLAVQLLQISQLAIQAADAGKIGIQHQKTAFVDALVQMYAQ
jgi:hypothetical protein